MRTALSSSLLSRYVGWEEVVISTEKGRREARYYLKASTGDFDLAVIGKEKSPRHMSYYYALSNHHLSSSSFSSSPSSSSSSSCDGLRLKSRREVVNWLSSMVSAELASQASSLQPLGSSLDTDCSLSTDIPAVKNPHVKKLGIHLKEFVWVGSSWECDKNCRHYQSFRRNGIKISVHDFVYVLAEENKQLVAYLEDLYEDSRGNKMVVVRWFHKLDEVGLVLPRNFNDREIFFSLCLQDLSVECIDGLATILSPQHFKKYLNEAAYILGEPFMCRRLFQDGELSTFDITQVQGYWKQVMLRRMYTTPMINHLNSKLSDNSKMMGYEDETINARPPKKQCTSMTKDLMLHLKNEKGVKEAAHVDVQKIASAFVSSSEGDVPRLGNGNSFNVSGRKTVNQMKYQQLAANSYVEVLSQDSGIRGCWFRAVVLKRHKDKVKVRYQDIKDAENEANYLEEWVLTCKTGIPDDLGIRVLDRTTIRPMPSSNEGGVSLDLVDVGAIVDAWWNDGWWEGIVICKESKDRIHVYFPGEGKLSIFGCEKLRISQDWVLNQWKPVKGRPDLMSQIWSRLGMSQDGGKPNGSSGNFVQPTVRTNGELNNIKASLISENIACNETFICSKFQDKNIEVNNVQDLSKDGLLTRIKWKSSRKRGRRRDIISRSTSSSSSSGEDTNFARGRVRFLVPKSLNTEHEKCSYRGDSLGRASMPLANLVMSR